MIVNGAQSVVNAGAVQRDRGQRRGGRERTALGRGAGSSCLRGAAGLAWADPRLTHAPEHQHVSEGTMATDWDDHFRQLEDASPEKVRAFNRPPDLERGINVLAKRGCRKVLLVGPGPGEVPAVVAQHGFDVVSFDISRVALRWGRRYVTKGAKPWPLVGDARLLPIRRSSFRGAMVLTVLSLYESPVRKAIARELECALAPGGVLLCWHYMQAFPEYRRVRQGNGTLTPLYRELGEPYPGFVDYDAYFDPEGNPLPGSSPPQGVRLLCQRVVTANGTSEKV